MRFIFTKPQEITRPISSHSTRPRRTLRIKARDIFPFSGAAANLYMRIPEDRGLRYPGSSPSDVP